MCRSKVRFGRLFPLHKTPQMVFNEQMVTKIDKRTRAQLFRTRLNAAMADAGANQTTVARQTGVDRSTISQLLKDGARMPNAHVAAACAATLGVSSDWLLGLSDRPEQAADIAALSMTMTEAPRALVDERIFEWHQQAAGYKIRHVPAGLPDMLKTDAFLSWEYAPSLGRTTQQAVGASRDRLNWMQDARSDYEIAIPIHELRAFAAAEGYYKGLPKEIRIEQLDQLQELYQQLFPSLRLFLFDARRVFSAPTTIFGPLLAVIYLGSNYLAFRDAERVKTITAHFDKLVRESDVTDRDIPTEIARLRARL